MIIGIFDNTGKYGNDVATLLQYHLSNSRLPLLHWKTLSYFERNSFAKTWLIRTFSRPVNNIISDLLNISIKDLEGGEYDNVTIKIGSANMTISSLYTKIRGSLQFNVNKEIWIDSLLNTYNIENNETVERNTLFSLPINKRNWIIPDVKTIEEKAAIIAKPDSKIIYPIMGNGNKVISVPNVIPIYFENPQDLNEQIINLINP